MIRRDWITALTAHVWNDAALKISIWVTIKGGFFSESAICFLDLQISKKNIPKNYLELEI